jgi:GNAT superfamily N-acetyltransferase
MSRVLAAQKTVRPRRPEAGLHLRRTGPRGVYVLPRFRGTGLGRLLVEELVRDARSHGYRRMVLDSLPSMRPAQALYSSVGFKPIPAYYDNPLPGVIYMALDL